MKVKKDKSPFCSLRQPWSDNANPIWLASTLKFRRNLAKYAFPNKLSLIERQQVLNLLGQHICTQSALKQPYLVKAEDTSGVEKEFLYEHFLATVPLQQAMAGEGFIVDNTGQFFAIFNIQDHLQLQMIDCTQELESSWSQIVKIESEIGSILKYAFSPRFGFLTSDPTHCGTGFSVHVYLHLPALIQTGQFEDIIVKHKEEEIEATTILGRSEETLGDIVALHNTCSLGLTDENILQALRTRATKLVVAEKSLRSQMRDSGHEEMKDKVSRAFGLLMHSYNLETFETWKAISLLKLGIDVGWVNGIDHKALNELLFTCRRGHLTLEFTEEIPQEQISHKRAEFVHAFLRNCHLVV